MPEVLATIQNILPKQLNMGSAIIPLIHSTNNVFIEHKPFFHLYLPLSTPLVPLIS